MIKAKLLLFELYELFIVLFMALALVSGDQECVCTERVVALFVRLLIECRSCLGCVGAALPQVLYGALLLVDCTPHAFDLSSGFLLGHEVYLLQQVQAQRALRLHCSADRLRGTR